MRRVLITIAAMAVVAAACSSDSSDTTVAAEATTTTTTTVAPMMADDIVAVATAAGGFTTLLAAADAAGLVETLQGEGPFTVFAPTDEAFAALPEGTLEGLLADPQALRSVLLYHVVAGKVLAADVVGLDSATSVEGEDIDIAVDGGMVMVNEANVVSTDIEASNGVIHVIDGVLLPPSISGAEAMADAEPMDDIVDAAVAAGSFSTLVAAVQAAGLVDTLKSDGPFTVFAPTDEAFAALPEGTVEGLLADPQALRSVLLYHVVAGKVLAADVVGLDSADTVEGSAIEIEVADGKVFVNDAEVVTTDIITSNGVIHVIDGVLLPPAA